MKTDTPGAVQDKFYLCDRFAELERELAAANARIAQLTEAGDRLENHLGMEIDLYVVQDAVDAWNKAKYGN